MIFTCSSWHSLVALNLITIKNKKDMLAKCDPFGSKGTISIINSNLIPQAYMSFFIIALKIPTYFNVSFVPAP